jgi:hypothetical protein
VSMYNDYGLINWNNLVEISDTSPSGLIWKINIQAGRYLQIPVVNVGDAAGGKHYQGEKAHAWTLGYNGRRYYAHRIIWLLKYNSIPSDKVIDHIDGNPFNNQLSNLRLVSQHTNARNRKILPTNTTGINGVCINEKPRPSGKIDNYVVICWVEYVNGHRKYNRKSFNLKNFKSVEQALEFGKNYRDELLLLVDDKTPAYTERHGK